MSALLPGTVLAVRSSAFSSEMIRLGAALLDHPNIANHIAVVDHTDDHNVTWCIEGKPGGVGWRNAADYLTGPMSKWTMDNRDQPLTNAQRAAISGAMKAMLGTRYDWEAIVADGIADLHLGELWLPLNGVVHGETVCSALSAYGYDKAAASRPPGRERTVQPADWTTWIMTRGWER